MSFADWRWCSCENSNIQMTVLRYTQTLEKIMSHLDPLGLTSCSRWITKQGSFVSIWPIEFLLLAKATLANEVLHGEKSRGNTGRETMSSKENSRLKILRADFYKRKHIKCNLQQGRMDEYEIRLAIFPLVSKFRRGIWAVRQCALKTRRNTPKEHHRPCNGIGAKNHDSASPCEPRSPKLEKVGTQSPCKGECETPELTARDCISCFGVNEGRFIGGRWKTVVCEQ